MCVSPTLSGNLSQQVWKLHLYDDSYAFRLNNYTDDAKSLFIAALSAKQIIQQVNHEITVCVNAK